jgi:hypothetical protein
MLAGRSGGGEGVWNRKSVTDKKDGSPAIYIPSTKHLLLVYIKMRKIR